MKKDTRKLIQRLRQQGFSVIRTARGHYTVRTASGVRIATLPAALDAPGGHARGNTVSDLKRAGFRP
jgi:hypothetical protein